MLMSFFILSGLFIVLVAVLVSCAKEVVQSREALAEQRALLQQMMTSLTKTQGRGARSIAMRSQSYRQILRDVPGVDRAQAQAGNAGPLKGCRRRASYAEARHQLRDPVVSKSPPNNSPDRGG